MCLAKKLGVKKGITAFVGGGGKTTAIFTLARELAGKGARVAVTTTTHMERPPVDFLLWIAPHDEDFCIKHGEVVVFAERADGEKIVGASETLLSRLESAADYLLVEADGAKRLPIKAPANHEPVMPENAALVVGVMGLSALNRPLCEVCFRHELAAEITGIGKNELVTPEILVGLACSPCGLKKNVASRFVLLLNQVDAVSGEMAVIAADLAQKCGVEVVLTALEKRIYI